MSPGASDRFEVPVAEHRERVRRLQERLEVEGIAGMVVFGPTRVSYLCGFFFAPTERPVALVIPTHTEPTLLVPRLETEHAEKQCPQIEQVRSYPEYPGGGSGRHPMQHLRDALGAAGLEGHRVGCDVDGYEHRWGYRGPRLSEVHAGGVEVRLEWIDDARTVKSETEIALIVEACRWGDRAHEILADGIAVGADELLASHAASLQATREMLSELGNRYVPKSREGMPAQAMFIRGANTAYPHGLHRTGGVATGDVLVTGAFGVVGGYESELERTMFVGEPDLRARRYFEAMVTAQDVAFDALRPGRTCAEVEADVRSFIAEELGMDDYVRHHTGHAFGLEGHEHPFLDLDDDTVIQPNMIFSLEPGLYVPELAGFRHSDTVLVTEDGCRNLCGYPRDLEALII